MLYDEAILTDVIDLTTEIAPARDYANKVAEYTNDPQLINIAKDHTTKPCSIKVSP